jgi:hypothetical protein
LPVCGEDEPLGLIEGCDKLLQAYIVDLRDSPVHADPGVEVVVDDDPGPTDLRDGRSDWIRIRPAEYGFPRRRLHGSWVNRDNSLTVYSLRESLFGSVHDRE